MNKIAQKKIKDVVEQWVNGKEFTFQERKVFLF